MQQEATEKSRDDDTQEARNVRPGEACQLMRQVTDATDPSYLAGPCGGRPPRVPYRSSGWLRGGFRSVPRRVSTVPDSLQLGL